MMAKRTWYFKKSFYVLLQDEAAINLWKNFERLSFVFVLHFFNIELDLVSGLNPSISQQLGVAANHTEKNGGGPSFKNSDSPKTCFLKIYISSD